VRVDDLDGCRSEWGTRTVVVDSRFLRFVLFPEVGAKIFSVVHKPTGKEVLWRNSAVPPRELPPGSAYDDCWSGGWDELFPNDEAASLNGEVYPDHGELWAAKWACDIETGAEEARIYLRTTCPVSKCRVEKWITVNDREERLRFRHRLTNLCDRTLPYLWKLHPALAVSPGDSVLIPAASIRLEPECLGTLGGGPRDFAGPVLHLPDRIVDVRVVPPRESGDLHFFYGLDLREGWCASYDPARRLAVAWSFPKELFTSCWLFASYGGWRDHYVAVLEPCTAFPFRLEQAAARGQCAVLPPLGVQEASVVFSSRQGVDGVSRVSPGGEVES
jgi:hypothetical protein